MDIRPPWWGHSKEHGWVVLDRDIPCNIPGARGELMFFRCRDEKIFFLKFELWEVPLYEYAPNYARKLGGAAVDEALIDFENLKGRWPELKLELTRQYQEIQDREQEERRAEEKLQKDAASARKKQRTAKPGLKVVAAAEE